MEIQPASSFSPHIFLKLAELVEKGERAALVTIIETSGSTPQVPGAKAIITADGLKAGTIGGGYFEATIIERAKGLLNLKQSELILWNFAADEEQEGSICGGQALVMVDGFPEKDPLTFKKLADALRQRRRGLLTTILQRQAGEKIEINRLFWEEDELSSALGEKKNQSQEGFFYLSSEEISDLFHQEKPKLIKKFGPNGEEKILFFEPVGLPPRLLIFGAGHVGQAVAQLGLFLGFEIYLFDDRQELGLPAGIKDRINFIVADMAESLEKFSTDESCYVIIVTRGHRYDGEVLRAALKKKVGYIGMIGSRRKVALMKEEFLRNGWASEADWAQIHSPIGFDIGARTVEEIAVSIMAEVIATRRRGEKRL